MTAHESEKVRELLASAKSMLAFIEMKLAHTGAQTVEEILAELKRVANISHVGTAHHTGCAKTTRTVDLARARAVIEEIERLEARPVMNEFELPRDAESIAKFLPPLD